MAKVKKTVNEVLEEIAAKRNENGKFKYNRFSKKDFSNLLLTMANDVDFKSEVVKVRRGEVETTEELAVTQGFRKWCRKLVEKAGIDASESARVLSSDFEIDDMDGIYEFIATAIYLYIEKGNRFDFLPKKDFKGSLYLKENDKKTKTRKEKHPTTGEYLGEFETITEEYRSLAVKSPVPKYLKKRRRIDV